MFYVFLIKSSFQAFPGQSSGWAHAANAGGVGSIPGLGTKIPHATQSAQKIKNKKKK